MLRKQSLEVWPGSGTQLSGAIGGLEGQTKAQMPVALVEK